MVMITSEQRASLRTAFKVICMAARTRGVVLKDIYFILRSNTTAAFYERRKKGTGLLWRKIFCWDAEKSFGSKGQIFYV